MSIIKDTDYKHWLGDLKSRIRRCQIKAAVAVNNELLHLYWDLGRDIAVRQMDSVWGSGFFAQLSKDLKTEFQDMTGFSATNLKYCKRFYLFYSQARLIRSQTDSELPDENHQVGNGLPVPIRQQLVDELENSLVFQIPWGHHVAIFTKCKSVEEAMFYVRQTVENGWSRDVLGLQLKSQLYHRQGKAISNFAVTLPEPMSDLAQQTLKDPYVFDFFTMTAPYQERDIEEQIIRHLTRFMLELGKGFAFVGRQYHLEIADNDYYVDLLFYHIRLKCYIVVELKNTKFIPEYAGKLNFYLSAVDSLLKQEDDKPTIGILLCRDKNNIEAEFALRDIHKPIGVSEFSLIEQLPEDLKSSLPTAEEFEEELNRLQNEPAPGPN